MGEGQGSRSWPTETGRLYIAKTPATSGCAERLIYLEHDVTTTLPTDPQSKLWSSPRPGIRVQDTAMGAKVTG